MFTSISYASNSVEELQNVINTELKGLNDWLTTNKLSLNIVKTEFMAVGSRQRIKTLINEIYIELNGNMVNQVTSVKSLGVILIITLCGLSILINYVKKLSIQVYQALIQPHFDYCRSVCDGLGETLNSKLQKLQNRAVRVITRFSYDTNAAVLLDTLHLDNLSLRRKTFKAGLMFKTLKGNTPTYLQNLFSVRGSEYNLSNFKK